MSKYSTFLKTEEAKSLVKALAEELRSFFDYILSPDESSNYFSKAKFIDSLEPDIKHCIEEYKANKALYTDDELVKKGADYKEAIKHAVRIEVRKVTGVNGVAQIAMRGIPGDFRVVALKNIKAHKELAGINFGIRVSGGASLEANVVGVDKALPLRYLKQNFDQILDVMGYTPGDHIDSRRTKTVIAADGDRTTYDNPTIEHAPTLKESVAFDALIKYLSLGGIYVVISGNNMDRTVGRIAEYLPDELKSRFIIVSNGGSNMAVFDRDKNLLEVQDYLNNGLKVLEEHDQDDELDIIYIGDDGRLEGNDRDAFEQVGAAYSILVANPESGDIIPQLKENTVGGLVVGTKKILEGVVDLAIEQSGSQLFLKENVARLVKVARIS